MAPTLGLSALEMLEALARGELRVICPNAAASVPDLDLIEQPVARCGSTSRAVPHGAPRALYRFGAACACTGPGLFSWHYGAPGQRARAGPPRSGQVPRRAGPPPAQPAPTQGPRPRAGGQPPSPRQSQHREVRRRVDPPVHSSFTASAIPPRWARSRSRASSAPCSPTFSTAARPESRVPPTECSTHSDPDPTGRAEGRRSVNILGLRHPRRQELGGPATCVSDHGR